MSFPILCWFVIYIEDLHFMGGVCDVGGHFGMEKVI